MNHRITYRLLPVLLGVMLLQLSACEDQPPTDYQPTPFLEGYLIVDEPIEGIVVAISQPITEPFQYDDMMLPNADVVLTVGETEYPLQYVIEDGIGSYRYPDTTVKVLPETRYALRVG
ncbi:MAG: hypothetical protein RRA94_00640, partial [Bacteroidota bacterium]|nr:hypothetical protein [Bacteroidota bacterium]